jgi:hypothetical protein
VPIAFSCPHCGCQTNVADRFAGQTGPCSACGQPVTVPTLAPQRAMLPPRRRGVGGWIVGLLLGIVMFTVCSGLITGRMGPNRQPGLWDLQRRVECCSNLDQIATAMTLYEDDHGCLPPAYTADAEGRRLHSWRTLLLPYLGEEELYESLDLDEPWDSEANRPWHTHPIDVYQCPADPLGEPTDVNYLMIVGGEGLFDADKAPVPLEIEDGPTRTILLVEQAGTGIHWMEPRDMPWDEIDFSINGDQSPGICSEHEGGAHIMMCDGVVEFLDEETTAEEVRAAATPRGGETLPVRDEYIVE